jgi:hypothetical protein
MINARMTPEIERKRLRAKRIVEHPDVATHQGVLHPAQQESGTR